MLFMSRSDSLKKLNETGSNVVTPNTLTGTNILGAGRIDDGLDAFFELFILDSTLLEGFVINVFVAPGDGLLGGHAVPETITSQKDELAL